MSLFTTPAKQTPSIRNVPPAPQTDLDKYNENLKEFRACETELADAIFHLRAWYAQHGGVDGRVSIIGGEVFCRMAANHGKEQLAALESEYNRILRKRSQLLARHAELKAAAGIE